MFSYRVKALFLWHKISGSAYACIIDVDNRCNVICIHSMLYKALHYCLPHMVLVFVAF